MVTVNIVTKHTHTHSTTHTHILPRIERVKHKMLVQCWQRERPYTVYGTESSLGRKGKKILTDLQERRYGNQFFISIVNEEDSSFLCMFNYIRNEKQAIITCHKTK